MSASVHPTVQRFVLDEDCVFLLCSDGLSDYDLVEQCWQTEILPILDGKVDVTTASQQLVAFGNTRNGHDNITVALTYCQVDSGEPSAPLSYSVSTQTSLSETNLPTAGTVLQQTPTLDPDPDLAQDTQLLPSERSSRRSFVPVLLGIGLLLSLSGGLVVAYLANAGKLPSWASGFLGLTDKRSPDVSTETKTPVQPSFLVAKSQIVLNQTDKSDESANERSNPQSFKPIQGILPAGSVVQILAQQSFPQQGDWLNLKVCSIPSVQRTPIAPKPPNNPTKKPQNVPPSTKSNVSQAINGTRLLQPGDEGWIQAANKERQLLPIATVTPNQFGQCSTSTPQEDLNSLAPSP